MSEHQKYYRSSSTTSYSKTSNTTEYSSSSVNTNEGLIAGIGDVIDVFYLLMESGDFLLQESGDRIELE